MADRVTYHDGEKSRESSTATEFSGFMVRDSYSIPVDLSPVEGGHPGEQHRLSQKRLEELDMLLGERDKEIIHSLERFRYLKTDQIQRFYFTEAATQAAGLRAASRTLKKLSEMGLIDKLARRIGGVRAGSASMVWYLTHGGKRLLRLHNAARSPLGRHFDPSPYFLAHTLAVADSAIRITEACRDGDTELTEMQTEPDCWRSYNQAGVRLALKPDLYAATTGGSYEDRWFFEIDLHTESPAKVVEKCGKYYQYYRSGLEQEESGMFPLTVWVVESEERKQSLMFHIKEAFAGCPRLFAVIRADELESLIRTGGEKEMLC